jgi:hypothetical protein
MIVLKSPALAIEYPKAELFRRSSLAEIPISGIPPESMTLIIPN